MLRASFNPRAYGSSVQELIEPLRLAELGPGKPNSAVRAPLETLTDKELFAGQKVVDPNMAAACRAGLWLYHDFLDRSHAISQDIDTPTGSYWHAILHRREPDYANSKYWWRRVGRHPVFESLAADAHAMANESIDDGEQSHLATQAEWEPFGFVDMCQRVIGSGSQEESLCRRVQQREWELLFDYCWRQAIANNPR